MLLLTHQHLRPLSPCCYHSRRLPHPWYMHPKERCQSAAISVDWNVCPLARSCALSFLQSRTPPTTGRQPLPFVGSTEIVGQRSAFVRAMTTYLHLLVNTHTHTHTLRQPVRMSYTCVLSVGWSNVSPVHTISPLTYPQVTSISFGPPVNSLLFSADNGS